MVMTVEVFVALAGLLLAVFRLGYVLGQDSVKNKDDRPSFHDCGHL